MRRRHHFLFFKVVVCFFLFSLFFTGMVGWTAVSADSAQEQDLDYSDSLDTLSNPERGFYEPYTLHLKPEGTAPVKRNDNLIHLRVDLSAFSSNALLDEKNQVYGESMPLTEDALGVLEETFQYIQDQGHSVIVRTCYDPWYNGKSNYEPEQDIIIGHLQQLGALYTQYKDVIAYVELGTYGPWGEMHTSRCCTVENVNAALNALLEATPEDIKIGVRTPNYVAGWLGINNTEFDIESDIFQEAVAAKGSAAYRVGMFNDGYLGSGSDLGTYGNGISRENGVAWLNEFAQYTMYGGEVVADFTGSGSIVGPYNSVDYLSVEGFQTHTSYLNIRWNNNVIAAWKEVLYQKEGDEYDGQTGFKYVEDHLGYRLVLRSSKLTDAVPGGDLALDLQIENVGFANIINRKKASVILQNESGQTYEIACPGINPNQIVSGQNNNLSTAVSLPEDIALGTWKVYLRFSKYGDYTTDNNYQCIRFANDGQYWDETVGANYIGTVNVTEKPQETPSGDDGQGDNNQSGDDQGGDSQTGSGQGDDTLGGDSQSGSGQGDDTQDGASQGGSGQGDNTSSGDSQGGSSQGDNTQSGAGQTGGAGQGNNTQSGNSQTGNGQSGENIQTDASTQGQDDDPDGSAAVNKPAKGKILSLKNKKGRKIQIKIKKQKGATGYQIAYGTKKSIKKAKKRLTTKQTVTLKKVKKKRTYYVAVRAYRIVDGKKVFGKWSKIRRIKVRK